MMGTSSESANSIRSQRVASNEEEAAYVSFKEEVRYMSNQGASSCPMYLGADQGPLHPREENQGWKERDD